MKSSYLVAFACWIMVFAGSAHSQESESAAGELTRDQLQAHLAEKERELRDLQSLQRANTPNSTDRDTYNSRAILAQDPFGQARISPRFPAQNTLASPALVTRGYAQQGQYRFGQFFSNPKITKENNAIDQEIASLVQEIKKSEDDEEKAGLKDKVKQLLEKKYEIYLGQHETPLKELEARVEKLRDDLEARRNAKADLVKLKLDSIWYDAIGLRWPGNSGGNRTTIWGTSNYNRPIEVQFSRAEKDLAVAQEEAEDARRDK